MISIKYLEWDSVFFGLKIGQAEAPYLNECIINDLIQARQTGGFDLVYLFTDNLDSEGQGSTYETMGGPVDVKVTYSRTILPEEEIPSMNIKRYYGEITRKLIDLAIESGHMSRFRKDTRLSPRFIDMYSTWISGSVSGELADAVLVSGDQDDINGFVTLKSNSPVCTIGLIAVDNLSRGRGIGGELLKAAVNWALNKDCQEIRVATQMENLGACRLYEKNGYTRISTKYIFHF